MLQPCGIAKTFSSFARSLCRILRIAAPDATQPQPKSTSVVETLWSHVGPLVRTVAFWTKIKVDARVFEDVTKMRLMLSVENIFVRDSPHVVNGYRAISKLFECIDRLNHGAGRRCGHGRAGTKHGGARRRGGRSQFNRVSSRKLDSVNADMLVNDDL